MSLELSAQGFVDAASHGEVLVPHFIHEPWHQDGWCWAAMASMVHRCLTREHRPQCHWAERLISLDCCRRPHDYRVGQPVKEVLDLEGHCRQETPGPLSFSGIQSEIPEVGVRRPVVCVQPGHVVVLCGWGVDPKEGDYVWYADPAKQHLQWALYTVFRDRKGGGWIATFLTK